MTSCSPGEGLPPPISLYLTPLYSLVSDSLFSPPPRSHPGEVPTPLQVARREIIPELPPLKRRGGSGASLVEGLLSLPPAKANEIARIFRSESHMAFVSRGKVLLALLQAAVSAEDVTPAE